MEVRVEVNQVDFRNVHLGQKAEMHLDAYPGLALPATLEQLSPLGTRDNSANWWNVCDAVCGARAGTRDCCPICRRRWIWIWEARVRNGGGRAERYVRREKMFCVGERREFV